MIKENMYFDVPAADVIKSRHSVRTYTSEALSKEIKTKLTSYAKDIKGPFTSKVRLKLIDDADIAAKAGGKLGTYGVIKGARAYIAGVMEKGEHSEEQLGYCLERLVLYATSLGLGTCWLGGTFKKSEFAKLVNPSENELIPIVTPVGYGGSRRSIVESLMRAGAGSDRRKPWEELFFDQGFDKSLKREGAGRYEQALEMLRLAPSASNKQPWRILRDGSTYHFYLKAAKGYSSAFGFNMQKIDMGIAMCHFEIAAIESGIQGSWEVRPQGLYSATGDVEYIVSWIGK